ncbi:TonB-dependent receptor [Yunchengibacter salinarum]|uniref:TonB-dependent receptor n=1 Tax=Yunchengibacter salinarum TaxID=3133399 RepID=UPI0035B5B3FA
MLFEPGGMSARTRLKIFASASVIALATAPAMAQDQGGVDPVEEADQRDPSLELQEVVVTGFRSSIKTAIAKKRNAQGIVEALSAEDIGKLPDVSIAESLARLPGLTAQRLEGRAQVISIRGLSPDFSTALLNGREQVSVGDNRGVEFDQYPSELINGALVHKTPYAGLIGQGLAGTVNLQTIRPLESGERIVAVNARYEFNEEAALNPDSPRDGFRGSVTYVDQFADDTVGVALGAAIQSTPTQNEQFNAWGFPALDDNALVIGGSKPFVQSNDLDRVGLMGTLEYDPRSNFRTTLDLYYSDFQETQVKRGIELPLFWSAAQLQPGFTVDDGLVTEGTFSGVKGVMRNDLDKRDAELFAGGWNIEYDIADDIMVTADISYSRAERNDLLLESYAGTGPAGEGATDDLGFSIPDNGVIQFDPSLDYTDTSLFRLTDPQGWGAGSRPGDPLTQAGFLNQPEVDDELTHLKFMVDKRFESGFLANLQVGVDLSRRDKSKIADERFLTLGGATSAEIPESALLDETVSLDFIGIPGQVTYDPLALVESGVYTQVVDDRPFVVTRNWDVREDVIQSWIKADLDGAIGGMAVTGNAGVQVVYTDQESSGFTIQGGSDGSGGTVVDITDGDDYWRVLPSLNLNFQVADNTRVRLGAARTLTRPRMDQLSASQDLSVNFAQLTSTDPNQSFFSSSGGNARLRPYMSNSVDLSLEHYFADGAGIVSFALFYKDLEDYIDPNSSFVFDFESFQDFFLTLDQQAVLGTTQGIVSGPRNTGNGEIGGFEFSANLPADVIAPALEGFGALTSVSYTDSSIRLNPEGAKITVPGLSEWVVNSTLYFEKGGFEARISERYRSNFLGEVSGLSATRILRTVRGEFLMDAQISYEFQAGSSLEGLTVTLQGNNLTDEPFVTIDNEDIRQVIDHQRFGRTYLLGVNYKF